ncbi:acetyl-CoA carboxylase carboxyltransferase subunit beta [bacterium]|nr:acetyl-CoA carboxylase carboxyltransferase subunit beta [candidate division CSSED10-310 bacterium]
MGNKPWYKKERKPLIAQDNSIEIPPGLVETCKNCNERLYTKQLAENYWVCPKCDHHHRITSRNWLEILFDNSEFEVFDQGIYTTNPLKFYDSKNYVDRLDAARKKTQLDDACLNGIGKMNGHPVVVSALDFFFLGGSMGSVVGEKVTRAAEKSLKEKIPLVTVSCSGGARMQEGMFSLMQMAKTSHACGKLRRAGVPFISILADPSTAGVMASFASLGDIIIAEQNALIGFAGPRVIAQTIGGELPEGFQRANFCKEHGMVDIVLHRSQIPVILRRLISMFTESADQGTNHISV